MMHPHPIAQRRMHAQRLAGNPLGAPEDVVRWLGCVQSQDYGPAKWSVGERTAGATDAALDEAFNAGTILRTHVLRPTWHFVLPADIRWIQQLTAARVHAQNAYYYRQSGLEDAGVAETCTRLITGALRGGNQRTRRELEGVLHAGGLTVKGLGMAYVLMRAELDCVVCSGALRGRQHTYALFDERVPDAPEFSRDEAVRELVLRYFASRGPATAKDMRFWSSLTLADIHRGIEIAGPRLEREEIDGLAFWSAPGDAPPVPSPKVHLLQGLDEYFVGYGESRSYCDRARTRPSLVDRAIYNGALILDTQLAGHWKRAVSKRAVTFTVALSAPFDDAQMRALHDAADVHGAFLGVPAVVEAEIL